MSRSPIWFAHVVSRNIVPLGGVLFLGWNARNVLLLYFVDTVLAMTVIFAGLAGAFLPRGKERRREQFASGAGVIIPVMIVIVTVTLPFVLGRDFDWRAAMDDPALRIGVVWQAIAAFWSCRDLIRALRASTPEKLQLERRFGLVLSRWLTTLAVALLVPEAWFGTYISMALVAFYILLSIWIEVAPHHFLAAMQEEPRVDNASRARGAPARQRHGRKR